MAYAGWETQPMVSPVSLQAPVGSTNTLDWLAAIHAELVAIRTILSEQGGTTGTSETFVFGAASISTTSFQPQNTPGRIVFKGRAVAIAIINDGPNDLNYRVPYTNNQSLGYLKVGEKVSYDYTDDDPAIRPQDAGLQAVTGTSSARIFVDY